MELVPLLGVMAVFAALVGFVARRTGRRVWLWIPLGALFTIVALVVVTVLAGSRARPADGRSLADGLDHESRLRAQTEAEQIRRRHDETRTEAHRDMSSHIPGGGF